MRKISLFTSIILTAAIAASAAVDEQAHYNLKGTAGVRDMAGPETLKDQAGKSPDLARQGSPKMMSNGPGSAARGI